MSCSTAPPPEPLPPPSFRLVFDTETWDSHVTMPWLYFRVRLPRRPLPSLADRRYTTPRLLVRPLDAATDLDAFAALRARAETQDHSTSRGRPDRDRAESAAYLARLAEDGDAHWYFGAFLRETGELVGEGGIPTLVDMDRSGWPEAEFLLHRKFWRQGLGSEFWEAVVGAWWELPRELQRHQLFPLIVPDKEPGQEVEEIIGFVYEDDNEPARAFFAKMLQESRLSKQSGKLTTMDTREGREGTIVTWAGCVSENLRQPGQALPAQDDPSLDKP